MFKKTLRRLKSRYKYNPFYLNYRVRHNFSSEERAGFRALAAQVESFEIGRLFAVGNEGVIYGGLYRPAPSEPHLLKVSLNKGERYDMFAKVQDVVKAADLPFLCQVKEFGRACDNSRFWYQVQRKADGLIITRWARLPVARRLEQCNPVAMCIDLLDQTRALNALGVCAPNVDAENVLLLPNGSLTWIDLDPYFVLPTGSVPLYPLRRLFKLILFILEDFESIWRRKVDRGEIGCDPESLDLLFHRLRSSSLYGYDDPRKNRHRGDSKVNPRDCFTDLAEPRALLGTLLDHLH